MVSSFPSLPEPGKLTLHVIYQKISCRTSSCKVRSSARAPRGVTERGNREGQLRRRRQEPHAGRGAAYPLPPAATRRRSLITVVEVAVTPHYLRLRIWGIDATRLQDAQLLCRSIGQVKGGIGSAR